MTSAGAPCDLSPSLARPHLAWLREQVCPDPDRAAPFMVWDLDGTLFDNRPRTLAILHALAGEWAAPHPEWASLLRSLQVSDIHYRVEDTLVARGLQDQEAITRAQRFWEDRFFQNDYLSYDVPMPGAAAYLAELKQRGGTIRYLTGRDEPNQGAGTRASLLRAGFPLDREGKHLILKPHPAIGDVEFKRGVWRTIGQYGWNPNQVLVFVDNDPAQINAFLEVHPTSIGLFFQSLQPPNSPALHPLARPISTFLT